MLAEHRRMPREPFRSESGSIVILTALVMVVVLGIVAFAVDASFLYSERSRLSAAADAAAKAAAIENQRGVADLQPFADREVALHGFDPGGTTTVSVNRTAPGYVEVVVSKPINTFFARMINTAFDTITPAARAVAGLSSPQNCIVARGNFTLYGTALATLSGCDMAVGGTVTLDNAVGGSPPPGVSASGGCVGSCDGVATTDQPMPGDPLQTLPSPGMSGYVSGIGCPGGIPAGPTNPLPGGCYTSIPDTVHTLQSDAAFEVSGPININGGLSGTGVLLYLTGGGFIRPIGRTTLSLTAQTFGPYEGIALYADPGATLDLSGGSRLTLNVGGVVYMPNSDVDSTGRLSIRAVGGCLLLYFNNFSSGRGSITPSADSCFRTFPDAAFLGVALAE